MSSNPRRPHGHRIDTSERLHFATDGCMIDGWPDGTAFTGVQLQGRGAGLQVVGGKPMMVESMLTHMIQERATERQLTQRPRLMPCPRCGKWGGRLVKELGTGIVTCINCGYEPCEVGTLPVTRGGRK